jgi:hypothetical protein
LKGRADFADFANLILPMERGAPELAFPRLNALSYYLFAVGGIVMLTGYTLSRAPLRRTLVLAESGGWGHRGAPTDTTTNNGMP